MSEVRKKGYIAIIVELILLKKGKCPRVRHIVTAIKDLTVYLTKVKIDHVLVLVRRKRNSSHKLENLYGIAIKKADHRPSSFHENDVLTSHSFANKGLCFRLLQLILVHQKGPLV